MNQLLRHRAVSSALGVLLFQSSLAVALTSIQGLSSQSQTPGLPKAERNNSTTVVAKLSPEEIEEGNLNDRYQLIAEQQRKGTCTVEIIERYRSDVIPRAEKSVFNVPKNKFLFLANRDIGNCYLVQHNFVEAESAFRKILQYAPVWPGIDDSAYAINFRQIATAQMGQQSWQAAEASLKKSITLFNPLIDNAVKSKSDFYRFGHAGNLRGSKAESFAYLGIVYLRERRVDDALKTIDLAFAEANQPNVSPRVVSDIVTIGRSIAQASGNKDAIAKWSQRG